MRINRRFGMISHESHRVACSDHYDDHVHMHVDAQRTRSISTPRDRHFSLKDGAG